MIDWPPYIISTVFISALIFVLAARPALMIDKLRLQLDKKSLLIDIYEAQRKLNEALLSFRQKTWETEWPEVLHRQLERLIDSVKESEHTSDLARLRPQISQLTRCAQLLSKLTEAPPNDIQAAIAG
jgi:hypothetical protein